MAEDAEYEALTKANNQSQSGNVDGACKTLEAYLVTDPHNNKVRLALAKICADYKRTDYALLQLDIILDIDPDNVDARKALITMLKPKRKNNKETAEHYEYLVKLCPDDAELFNSYAIFCKMQLTDFEKAAKNYERAIEINPNNATYRLNYAILLVNELKRYDEGRAQMEKAVELEPNNQRAKDALQRLIDKKFSDGKQKKGLFSFLRRR